MSVLKATRSAQKVMSAEFSWTAADTMLDITGASTGFISAAAHTVDVINLPPGAIIVGGELVRTTAFDGSTYAVIVGDSGSANRYLGTADYKAAGRTALVPTGYVGTGENIRLTITPTGSVGVGTASPAASVETTGGLRIGEEHGDAVRGQHRERLGVEATAELTVVLEGLVAVDRVQPTGARARLAEAREGDVLMSRELATALMMLAGAGWLLAAFAVSAGLWGVVWLAMR